MSTQHEALMPRAVELQAGPEFTPFPFPDGTVQTFFAPAVGVVADRLHLAPDVAGATLLAFGNAAADMFTQIAAIAMSPEVGWTRCND